MYALHHTKGKTDTKAFEFCYHCNYWSHGVMPIFRQLRNTCRHVDSWTSRPPPLVRANRFMFFFAWISAAVTNVSACCNESAKERKKNKFCFWPLPFVHTWFCHHRCRDCAAKNPHYDFVRSQTKLCWTPSLPYLTDLCLETNCELMIWSLSWWKVASVATHPLAPVVTNAHCAIQLHWLDPGETRACSPLVPTAVLSPFPPLSWWRKCVAYATSISVCHPLYGWRLFISTLFGWRWFISTLIRWRMFISTILGWRMFISILRGWHMFISTLFGWRICFAYATLVAPRVNGHVGIMATASSLFRFIWRWHRLMFLTRR